MITLTFNSKTSPCAKREPEANLYFIRYTGTYLVSLQKIRGYVYLNEIYESFGITWNPDDENLCLRYNPDIGLRLDIRRANEDGFDFDIIY